MRNLLLFVVFLNSIALLSQPAPQSNGSTNSFLEQIQRFELWRQSHRLDTVKGWQYYKRWEHEQLMHMSPQGTLDQSDEYLREVLKATQSKRDMKALLANKEWLSVGPTNRPPPADANMQNGMGRVNCIAFHPKDSSLYYVGVAQGGIWKTTDNGQTWKALSDDFPIMRISDIAIDQKNPNTLYAAIGDFEYLQFGLLQYGNKRNTYYGLGVYKSTDAGESFEPTGLALSLESGEASLICKVIVHPLNSNYVVAVGVSGRYYSSDAGKSWMRTDTNLTWDLQLDPTNPNLLYAASGYLSRSKIGRAAIWKSMDFGVNWVELNTGIPPRDTVERVKIAIAPSAPRTLYAATTNLQSGLYALYRSTNAGQSWERRFDSLNVLEWQFGKSKGGQGTYDLVLQVNAQNPDIVYIGGVNLWTSKNGGLSFHPASFWTAEYGSSIHADLHLMSYQATSGNYFICHDGGVDKSNEIIPELWDSLKKKVTTFKTRWTPVAKNMSISSFYRVSSSRKTDARLLAGAQDNSTSLFNGTDWKTVLGGDGMDNWLDATDDRQYIAGSQYGFFAKSKDGLTLKGLDICREQGEWTTPLVADYSTRGVLYAGYGNLYRTTDYGDTWMKVTSFKADTITNFLQEICAIAVSPSHPKALMFCKRIHIERNLKSSCFRSDDGGQNWQNVTKGLPDSLYFTSIEISEDDPNLVWLSCAGLSRSQKVYQSTNGGQDWTNISYDLPNLPVNVIKHVPGSKNHLLMIGTDVGVYCRNDTIPYWLNYSTSLPNVIVTDLEMNTANKTMYASTFGRGVWATEIITEVPTSITELSTFEESQLELFPSPLQNRQALGLRFHSATMGQVQMEIIDSRAKLLRRMQSKKDQHLFESTIDMDLPAGVYLLRLIVANNVVTKKFIIE